VPNDRKNRSLRLNGPPLLVLTSLSSGDKHGHALLKDIEAITGNRLGPGTLYGAIGRLEDQGLIEPVAAEGRQRPYRITAAGTATLTATIEDLRRIVDEGSLRLADRAAAAGLVGGAA
jgi:DNA-binding PadR family transcriptional regulator